MIQQVYCYPAVASDIITDLQSRGFNGRLSMAGAWLFCPKPYLILKRNQFQVMEMFFLPGEPGWPRELMIYAIWIPHYGVKGMLLLSGANSNIMFLTPG